MNVLRTDLPGVLIVEPQVHGDARGEFFESYHAARYADHGIPGPFVQDNQSRSIPGTIRGLHYQLRQPQGKLVRCVRGMVVDVAVDIRRGSPSFARWIRVELSAANKRQLYIPPGFAHGFAVPDEESEIAYKCTDYYAPDDQCGVRWSDATIGIPWPIAQPIISEQDERHAALDSDRGNLPAYHDDGA